MRYTLVAAAAALALSLPSGAEAAGCGKHTSGELSCRFSDRAKIMNFKQSHILVGGTLTVFLNFEEALSAPLEVSYYTDYHYDEYGFHGWIIAGNNGWDWWTESLAPGSESYTLSLTINHPVVFDGGGWDDAWIIAIGRGAMEMTIHAPGNYDWSYEWHPVTDEVFTPVPEPASWAMMIAGFGMVGAAMRRSKTASLRSRARSSAAFS